LEMGAVWMDAAGLVEREGFRSDVMVWPDGECSMELEDGDGTTGALGVVIGDGEKKERSR
jgi:hypothetical protein